MVVSSEALNQVLAGNVQIMMHRLLILAVAGLAYGAQPEALEIIRRSLEAEEENFKRIRDYAYVERVETHDLEGDGRVKSTKIKTHHVVMIEGSPFKRLLAQDDKPLGPGEELAELERLRWHIEQRHKEEEQKRAKRIAEYEKKRNENRAAIREIPDAFDFRLAGEETINSRPAYVIEATPRPGYRHKDRRAKLFTRLKGKLWVDKAEYHWVRVEAELLETITFGWILVRIHEGGRVKVEQTRVSADLWMPSYLWFVVSLRIGLIKHVYMEETTTYSDFRKSEEAIRLALASAPR